MSRGANSSPAASGLRSRCARLGGRRLSKGRSDAQQLNLEGQLPTIAKLSESERTMSEQLGEREREVLRAIIQEYIVSGGPVGSSQLARRAEFDVSAATMRNVMADLEELGYIQKPHTSAGPGPTHHRYRLCNRRPA